MYPNKSGQRACRLASRNLRIGLDLLDQLVVALVAGVVLKDIKNETFLDCLAHAVVMERGLPVFPRLVKDGECFELGRGGECKEAQIGLLGALQLLAKQLPLSFLAQRLFVHVEQLLSNSCFDAVPVQYLAQLHRGFAALRAVCFVHDDSEALPCGRNRHTRAFGFHGADGLGDERELLNCGNDDGHAIGQRPGQLLCVLVDLLNHPKLVLKLEDRVL